MKYEDVKIGMKVVPLRKSIKYYSNGIRKVDASRKNLLTSNAWKRAKAMGHGFLYVRRKNDKYVTLTVERLGEGGDFFLAFDFVPYKES